MFYKSFSNQKISAKITKGFITSVKSASCSVANKTGCFARATGSAAQPTGGAALSGESAAKAPGGAALSGGSYA